ncbi:MAG: hypothetical protein HWN68_18580 [Desulfobacterales bacterium]|nr:hypothetical protein [Desulfobacterales bacterium]
MTTYTNDLTASAFLSGPDIHLISSASPNISLRLVTEHPIEFQSSKPVTTPKAIRFGSITVLAIPIGSVIASWQLKSILLVQIRYAKKELLATTWLQGISEYGVGQNQSDAITDLIVSLGEYFKSLKKRKRKLGNSALNELAALERLIEPL